MKPVEPNQKFAFNVNVVTEDIEGEIRYRPIITILGKDWTSVMEGPHTFERKSQAYDYASQSAAEAFTALNPVFPTVKLEIQ